MVFAFILRSLCQLDSCVTELRRKKCLPERLPFLPEALPSANASSFSIGMISSYTLGVQYIRYESCTDTLNLVGTALAFGENRRCCRLYCYNLYIRFLGFQILANSGQGSAGAYACYKDVYISVGIVPDLRTGCLLCVLPGLPGLQTVPG